MKQKKILLSILAVVFMTTIVNAQTNTFPATGNVGIGTITPGTSLDVTGNYQPTVRIQSSSSIITGYPSLIIDRKAVSQSSNFTFSTNNVTNWSLGCPSSSNALNLQDGSGNAIMYVDPATNYIGLRSSGAPFPVTVATGVDQYGVVQSSGAMSIGTYLSGAAGGEFGTYSNHNLGFFTNNGSPSMTLNTSGNVGIGTTTPSAKLAVVGDLSVNRQVSYQIGGPTGLNVVSNNTNTGGATGANFDATGAGGNVYAVNANAHGTGTNFGIYGNATGGTKNWAGYFNSGSVYVNDTVCIGVTTPNSTSRLTVKSANNKYGIINTNGTITLGTYISSTAGIGEFGTKSNHPLAFFTNNSGPLMTVATNGNVGIGTITPAYKLDVCGTIRAKEIRVATGWCDYVFEDDYKLMSLTEVENYIAVNKHLPGIAPASEVESEAGLRVGEMMAAMMKKIEEQTLYTIQQSKQMEKLKTEIEILKSK